MSLTDHHLEIPIVSVRSLSKTFGSHRALDSINFDLPPNRIYGLFGRNGAGKTTLLTTLASQTVPDTGSQISLFGHQKVHGNILTKTHLMRCHQPFAESLKVSQILNMAALAYKSWDDDFARSILSNAKVPLRTKARKLSDGQKSWVGIAVALASRAQLTLMDEPYNGLDPVARAEFYDLLLCDFTKHPRTFIISTHLIDEIAPILNQVLIIENGRLTLDSDVDDALYLAHEIAGSADAISVYLARTGLKDHATRERSIGSLRTTLVAAELTVEREKCAASLGVQISPISLKDSVAVFTAPHVPTKTHPTLAKEDLL